MKKSIMVALILLGACSDDQTGSSGVSDGSVSDAHSDVFDAGQDSSNTPDASDASDPPDAPDLPDAPEAASDGSSFGFEVVHQSTDHLFSVAIDDTNAFAGGMQGLIAVPKAGGSATTLDTSTKILGVAVDATHVYFTSMAGSVRRVAKSGGASEPLYASQHEPWSIALDGSTLWFTEKQVAGDGCLYRVPADGSAPATPVDCSLCDPGSVAVGAGYVWVASFNCIPGELIRIPLAGGQKEVVASSSPLGVAVGGDHVFWSHHSGTLDWRAVVGGAVSSTPQNYDFAQGLVADATGVFITYEGVTGATGRLAHITPAGVETELASGFALPEFGFVNIGIDATHVYFAGTSTPFAGFAILRAPRAP